MEAVMAHLHEHYAYYLVAAIILLPPLIIFRRWTVPGIQYTVEYVIYLALAHGALWVIVRVAAWFKDQSTMKRARGLDSESYNPGWETPWLEFWNKDLYTPHWLMYFEIAVAVILFGFMLKYRGIGTQRRKGRRRGEVAKRPAAGAYQYKGKSGGSK